MKRVGTAVFALATAVAMLLAFAPSGPAAASHERSDLRLSASPLADGAWLLEARLQDRSAGPLGRHVVRFSATVQFLGTRPVLLGSVETDSSGTARLTYRPTWQGLQRLVARASFEDGTALSNEAVLEAADAVTPLSPPAARLPVVGTWAGLVAAGVAVSVWGLLGLVLIRVVFGISKATAVAGADGRPEPHGRFGKRSLGR